MRKYMKKFLSLVLVFAIALSIIPAISVEAKSGVIKKTVKKKFVIKKLDDQDDIDELGLSETVSFINECGGWYGVTVEQGYEWNEKKGMYVKAKEKGTYLTIWDTMTVAQAASSLKSMYGKYSCITNEDLKNDEYLTSYWLKKKLYKIEKKRHTTKYSEYAPLSEVEKEESLRKFDYAGMIIHFIETDPLLDPRESHTY